MSGDGDRPAERTGEIGSRMVQSGSWGDELDPRLERVGARMVECGLVSLGTPKPEAGLVEQLEGGQGWVLDTSGRWRVVLRPIPKDTLEVTEEEFDNGAGRYLPLRKILLTRRALKNLGVLALLPELGE